MQHGFRQTPLPYPHDSPHANSPQEGSKAKITILDEQKKLSSNILGVGFRVFDKAWFTIPNILFHKKYS
jgi:hypothetical protein